MQSVDVRSRHPASATARASEIDEVDLVPVRTYWQLVRQRFLRHRLAVIGARHAGHHRSWSSTDRAAR